MEVLAYRTQYKLGTAAEVIEWLIATPYGIGHFMIRMNLTNNANPTITTQFQAQSDRGWLKKENVQGVRKHIFYRKMAERARQHMVLFYDAEAPDMRSFEEKWQLGAIFQHDMRANNTWCSLTGRPVGTTYESIIADAQQKTIEARDERLRERAVVMATVDPEWGMF